MDGTVNRDHCITPDFVISLAKLNHCPEVRLQVIEAMESAAFQPLSIEGAGT